MVVVADAAGSWTRQGVEREQELKMTQPLWIPSESRVANANMTRFMRAVNSRYSKSFTSYDELHQWSIDHREDFWSIMWDFGGIVASHKGERILLDGDKMPGSLWFPDASLNFAENLLRYRDDRTAMIFRGESGRRDSISYCELYVRVAQLASAMRRAGLAKGDRAAGFMPHVIDTVVAMLAAASLGAVWSSCSPDFGINGVVDRFGQIAPKLLFTTDGYVYNGKPFNSLEKVAGILAGVPPVEHTVVVPFVSARPDLSGLSNAVLISDFVDTEATQIDFEQVPFNHPLYIMYSSGTTGIPKCIVHGVGGTLIQHLKELILHTDVTRDDTLFYFTTCGWMMWNWLVSGLASGARLLLFDGSPFHPHPGALFDIAAAEKVTVFGTSAKYLASIEQAGVKPKATHDVSSLKTLCSTGSPLSNDSFEYVYREIKTDIDLASISGGTDIISCFALGCPIKPVYSGELQCVGLGMDVGIFSEDGTPLRGEKGELVCRKSFPSMPIYFWDDPGGEKYHNAYFNVFPGIWTHGDYAELTEHNGIIMHGRSDAVLNPGGVRIGTSEIYRQVEKVEGVLEAIAVGQDWNNDVRVILFVMLKDGYTLDDALAKKITTAIRANTTPRHVPAKIIQVKDIPRTRNGKITELAVRKVIHGEEVRNRDALANPEALDYYRDLKELKS
jgi:acetoacetyl-CoA synthetase